MTCFGCPAQIAKTEHARFCLVPPRNSDLLAPSYCNNSDKRGVAARKDDDFALFLSPANRYQQALESLSCESKLACPLKEFYAHEGPRTCEARD